MVLKSTSVLSLTSGWTRRDLNMLALLWVTFLLSNGRLLISVGVYNSNFVYLLIPSLSPHQKSYSTDPNIFLTGEFEVFICAFFSIFTILIHAAATPNCIEWVCCPQPDQFHRTVVPDNSPKFIHSCIHVACQPPPD